ncbi:OmpA family protein [Arcobacter cloacae]|uniref:OmpA-like domain-containing protein n=1 Tax=Arcobacter cloacae TaxID=1054034 RepID=A0A4V1LVF6_9BACT|nr:OmpA family protein [Arcobacter cloacae]RXJ83925.1 hypothetical protein CRU90_07575 [Arcobacter cloacae]
MNDLEKLRNLLLKEEQESLSKLEIELNNLKEDLDNPKLIIEKIYPLIFSILEKSYTKDKKLLVDVLSPIVLELIDRNYEESKEKVTKQLAPLISTAIKEQIKSHKDEVVDALYPVIGNMVTRYVSKTFEDMINSINLQIRNGLSFKTLKRKIKAKYHGISETELLLKENALTNIRAVFFIHKETGIVLSHIEHENNPINEPEMIASMLTAIRSFVNDWVDKNEKHQEINTIEYGGSKIVLESSGYSYLAVIIDGAVTNNTINSIRNVLSILVSTYSDEIKNFNGDMQNIPKEKFYEVISQLISKNNEESIKKIHPLLYLIPSLFLSYILYIIYNNVIDNNLEKKANEILYKDSVLTVYRLDVEVKNKHMKINGVVPFSFYKDLAYKNLKEIKEIKSLENNIQVIDSFDNPKDIYDKITYLTLALNLKEGNRIEYSYNYPDAKIFGKVFSKKEKKYVQEQFSLIKGLKNIEFSVQVVPPNIEDIIYFEQNSSLILPNQEYKLINIINLLHKLDEDLVLEIQGFRDYTGTIERNAILVKERAENIMKYLKLKGNVSQKLVNIGVNEIPANIDEKNYPEQGRRVVFSWKR